MKTGKSPFLMGKKTLKLCSAGAIALCLGLGSFNVEAQTKARVKVCIGASGFILSEKTPSSVTKRLALAAKRRQLTVPVSVSGGGNTALSCRPTSKKARANTKILKVGSLDTSTATSLGQLLSTLQSLLSALGNTQLNQDVSQLANVVNSTESSQASEAADSRFAALSRTNIVFVRDTIRGVENVTNKSDPNGVTLFNLKIKDPITQPWFRLMADQDANMKLDARFVASPDGKVQLNEFVWRREHDGTLLVIHAPERSTVVVPERDQLELLLSYGDPFNPNQVIRLPLSNLQDSSYNFLGGTGPVGPLTIGTDESGQRYYGRSIVGLNGTPIGFLEFPEFGANGSGSRIIFKPAIANSWYYGGGLPDLSGTGMVFRRRGIGFIEAASIAFSHGYYPSIVGPRFAVDGIVDNLNVLLRDSVKVSSDVNATSAKLDGLLPWNSVTYGAFERHGSILGSLQITDVQY